MAAPVQLSDLTVLKLLASGKSLNYVATASGRTVAQVQAIGEKRGWPDLDQVDAAVRALEAARHRAAANPIGIQSASTTPSQPQQAAASGVEQLLARAETSNFKRTTAAAARIRDLLAALENRLTVEEAEEARKRQEERERAKARADVARLEAELAAAKAKAGLPAPKPRKPRTGPSNLVGFTPDYPVEEVRAWARANGLPTRGKYLARDTVAAWRAATGNEVSA